MSRSDGRPERSRPTLEEVAAAAGVSRGTASRVVNGSHRVSDATRASVQEVVHRLGYVPNAAARSLVTRRAESVAFIVAETESRVFHEPFFGRLLRGASQGLAATGLQLVLVMAWTAGERSRVERYVHNGHVDGVLLSSLHGDDPLPERLAASGRPVVQAGRPWTPLRGVDYVDSDNVGGARTATEYLLRQGRRRIATIAGPQDMVPGVDRLTGYRAALRGSRAVPSGLVAQGDFSRESGERAMEELLARNPDVDAVLAASDLMALGALRVLRASGRRVPEDVAVIGYDDSEVARNAEPALTSVCQDMEQMGREMVRLLVGRLEAAPGGAGGQAGGDGAGAPAPSPPLVLPTELVVRASA
ncbi:LacI family transcriptional regulator [Streptomyces sp. N2-109]|uniref:LacI family transcriptional regulator n=1 Tax=Streptomyces gossypii TaxID=2883101 RepID=A0ABT2JTI2_9ACTN|nr:LacI family DNA-binding transcriptional regulator [Streptomyces gossypii]MCT2591173.1 LacI family transcriptional regulator [Streptomyces gossypii]